MDLLPDQGFKSSEQVRPDIGIGETTGAGASHGQSAPYVEPVVLLAQLVLEVSVQLPERAIADEGKLY